MTATRTVAVLIEEGFDDDELERLLALLRRGGAESTLVAPFGGRDYRGRQHRLTVTSAIAASAARGTPFAALVIPGGYAPDRIRMRHAMLDLVRDALARGTPVAAIGHGAQVLISAGAIAGRTVTCWPSIAVDVTNAGGLYVDRPLVEDRGLFTARKIDDLAALVQAVLGVPRTP
jgi:protease I